MVLPAARPRSTLYAEDPTGSRNGRFTQTSPQPLSAAGAARKLAVATGLRYALFALCAPGVASGEAPPSTRAPPLGKPQAYTARDLLAAPPRPPSILTPSRPGKRSRAGLGIRGAACGRCGATCALQGPRILQVQLRGLSCSQN